jgi:hypothetical protein
VLVTFTLEHVGTKDCIFVLFSSAPSLATVPPDGPDTNNGEEMEVTETESEAEVETLPSP